MFNKVFILCSTGLLLLILLFGHDLGTYITTSASLFGDSVRDQIPLEFELKRARKMISDLAPVIHDRMHAVAREEIEIGQLGEQLADLKSVQENEKRTLTRLHRELESGKRELEIGNTIYTSVEATEVAQSSLLRYKTQDATMRSLQQTLDARQRSLVAARKKLDATIAAKQQLEAEVDSLDARRMTRHATRTSNDTGSDDTHLERTRELIRDIKLRIKVEERLVETQAYYSREPSVSDGVTDSVNIASEIASYFHLQEATSMQAATLAEINVEAPRLPMPVPRSYD